MKSEAAPSSASLETPVANRRDGRSRLISEIEAREGVRIGEVAIIQDAAKNFRWRQPRAPSLKVARSPARSRAWALRLQLRKAQAGPATSSCFMATRVVTHPCWRGRGPSAKTPICACGAPGQAKKVAMIGSLDHLTRQLIVHTSPTKRSAATFIAHLEQLDRLYGPQPGRASEAGRAGRRQWTRSMQQARPCRPRSAQALAHRRVAAKYAPELNFDIEVVWHDLKAHNLAHYTFTDAADLDRAIHQAVQALNSNERSRNPLVNWKISAMKIASHALASRGPVGSSVTR